MKKVLFTLFALFALSPAANAEKLGFNPKIAPQTCKDKDDGTMLIDLKKQVLSYCQNSEALLEYHVITGSKDKTPTPKGVFVVDSKISDKPLIKNYQAAHWLGLGAYTNPLTGKKTGLNFGIHTDVRDLPEIAWENADYLQAKGFGSAGCINVPKNDMVVLYKIIRKGSKIYIF